MRPDQTSTTRRSPRPAVALFLASIALALSMFSGCSRTRGQETTQITAAGSTSVTPFAEQLAEEFMRAHPGVHVNIQGIGSTAGIHAVQTGAADIGMSSRDLLQEEERTLEPIVMALDALAIIVHPSNTVRNLTLEQIRRIFAGEIRDWSEVGGPAAPITLVNREAGSGTRGAFEELVMGKNGPPLSYRSIRQGSNGAVRAVVEGDPRAIGYISLGIVNSRVRTIAVDGVLPTAESVEAGRYRLVRPFLMVVARGGELPKLSRDYIAYVLGDEGQRSLASIGLIPAPRKETPWKD